MKLIFHGAAREVGRSCIEVKTQGERYLLDAGIKFKENGFSHPENISNVADLDGLFLTHAHLDHSGALPLFEHYNIICPVFCTKMTYELTKIMLKDSYKVARIKHLHAAYTKLDLKKLDKSVRFVEYDKEYKHRNIRFTFRNAGHVPGSAMIELVVEGRKLLYTGDFKLKTTELMKGATTSIKDIDTLIMECTYGSRQLPEREQVKKRFIERIEQTVKNGGSVLIPVFALGRAQDILIMLSGRKFAVPIYYDGLCNKIAAKIVDNGDKFINNRKALEQMMKKVSRIRHERQRQKALQKQGIFITTSGMLQGGPVLEYLKEMWHEPKNAILLTGFQCKRTNGRMLEEEGALYIDGWKTYVQGHVEKFDFSGHADSEDLKAFIRAIRPKRIILNHGDEDSVKAMTEWAEQEGYVIYAPTVNEEI